MRSVPFGSILSTWWFLPAVIALSLNMFLAATRGSLDGHEVLVAQTAREMSRSNDWIHPTLAGTPRYQKPPLAYWLVASAYEMAGTASAFTARLPSVAASLLLTLLTAYVATKVNGQRLGRLAGLIQATMFWSLNYGNSAIVDMVLSLIVAVGIFAATADSLSIRSSRPMMIITVWMMAGFAVLAKGPVGFAIMLSTVALFRAANSLGGRQSNERFFLTWWTIPGLFCFVFFAIGWGAMVASTEPSVMGLWREQSFGRFLVHWGPQTRPWYYYLYQVPLLTLPWAPLWIYELWSSFHRRELRHPIDDLRRLCIIWFGISLMLLSLSEGKREHYILPGLVPLSILAALGGERLLRKYSFNAYRLMEGTVVLVVMGGVGFGLFEWHRVDEIESLAKNALQHRDRLDASPLVIQYGSNEHASCFIIDRPMKWCGSLEDVEASLRATPESLLLLPARMIGQCPPLVGWERLGSEDDVPSNSDRTLVLLARPRNSSH